jgi:Zn-dependent M16 (insulinase) family peptidase
VDVPEKFVVTFKPGKEMEEKVRELEQRLAAQGISLTDDAAAKMAEHVSARMKEPPAA